MSPRLIVLFLSLATAFALSVRTMSPIMLLSDGGAGNGILANRTASPGAHMPVKKAIHGNVVQTTTYTTKAFGGEWFDEPHNPHQSRRVVRRRGG